MYIVDKNMLSASVARRRVTSSLIKASRNEWMEKKYGVSDFSAIVEKHFWFLQLKPDVVAGFLARQIPGICVEDIAFTYVCDILGLEPWSMAFSRDCFMDGNHDKVARVRVPWTSFSKKGNQVLEYKYITTRKPNELNGVPFNRIETVEGGNVFDYHQALRYAVLGERGFVPDISEFWSEVLHSASHKPEFVYGLGDDDREVRIVTNPGLFDGGVNLTLRPPSKWYYPIYLSLFLTGELVLFETYENPKGGVPLAKLMFEEAMREVALGTGYRPLVVEIPPLSGALLQCNKALLDNPKSLLTLLVPEVAESSVVGLMHKIADRVRELR